jgi:hypothetical protein
MEISRTGGTVHSKPTDVPHCLTHVSGISDGMQDHHLKQTFLHRTSLRTAERKQA